MRASKGVSLSHSVPLWVGSSEARRWELRRKLLVGWESWRHAAPCNWRMNQELVEVGREVVVVPIRYHELD